MRYGPIPMSDPLRGMKGFLDLQVSARVPLPTRWFLAALGRATFPPGEGRGAPAPVQKHGQDPFLFAVQVACIRTRVDTSRIATAMMPASAAVWMPLPANMAVSPRTA